MLVRVLVPRVLVASVAGAGTQLLVAASGVVTSMVVAKALWVMLPQPVKLLRLPSPQGLDSSLFSTMMVTVMAVLWVKLMKRYW